MPFLFVNEKKGLSMNFAKTKRKKLGASLVTALALSLGLASNVNTVHADNAQMTDVPKGTNAQSNKIPGQYAFSGRIIPGITKITPFGGTSADWATSSSHTEGVTKRWYAFQLSYGNGRDGQTDNKKLKGKVGIYYSNIGVFRGHTVDLKVTMMDWNVQNYRWIDSDGNGKEDAKQLLDTAYVAFGKEDFEIFTPGMGAVKYRLDYYDHDTHKPIKLTAAWTFDDIDGNQWVGIDPTTMSSIDQLFYGDPSNGNTWLSYKKVAGTDYIYSDAKQHNTAIIDATGHNTGTLTTKDKKGSFTTTFSESSSYIINWVFGQNTGKHAVEEQNQLEKDSSYWNMVGKYEPNADKDYPITNISNSIDASNFNHAFLAFGTTPMLKDKPKQPVKYVSDSDEGTNIVSEIGTDKSVDHDILKNRYEKYHYQIMHDVPMVRPEYKYDQYIITDDLDKILDISDVQVYNRDNQNVTYMFTVNVDSNNRLTAMAKSSTLASDDFYRQQYKVTFDAKVKSGASLLDHADPKHKDQAVIYNNAKVTTSYGSAESNKTSTNIPFTDKAQTKAVSVNGNGKGDTIKVDYGQDFVYNVNVVAPDNENIKALEIKDTLEDVLNLKDVKVYDVDDNNKDVTNQGKLTKEANTADWIANEPNKWHGKHLQMVITASVKDTPDLMKYLDKDSNVIRIPNTAIWIINGKDDPTNTVYVEPNGPKGSVTKWIELQ